MRILWHIASGLALTWLLTGCNSIPNSRTAETTTDQARLAKIVIKSDDIQVYGPILEKITNQSLLARITVEAESLSARWHAVKKITNQVVLAEIAVGHKDWGARQEAVEKLADPATLARVFGEDKNPNVRRAAVGRIADQTLLANLVMEEKDPAIRSAAVRRLGALAELPASDERSVFAYATVKKITNQDALLKVVTNAFDIRERITAIGNLTNQTFLQTIARESTNHWVRWVSMAQLAHQAALPSPPAGYSEKEIAAGSTLLKVIPNLYALPGDHYDRLLGTILPVILTLSDPRIVKVTGGIVNVLPDWAETSQGYGKYLNMVDFRLKGEKFSWIVRFGKSDANVRRSWETQFSPVADQKSRFTFVPANISAGELLEPAFSHLPPSLLETIAMEDDYSSARLVAVRNLNDQAALARLAFLEKRENWSVRRAAVEKLVDQTVLRRLAVESQDWKVRSTAVEKLTDQTLVARIASEDKDPEVRASATRRLSSLKASQ